MIILGIDTSGKKESLTLIKDGRIVDEYVQEIKNHSPVLVPNILGFLQKNFLKLEDISGWGVAIGPGSFTGLRIGLASVLGLTFGKDVPVAGVVTLQAMAVIVDGCSYVSPAIDARKGEVYTGLYRLSGPGQLEVIEKERAIKADTWLKIIDNYKPCVWGSGVGRYRDIFEKFDVSFVEPVKPVSRGVAEIAYKKITNGYEGKPDEPLYLRKSEAEINLERRKIN